MKTIGKNYSSNWKSKLSLPSNPTKTQYATFLTMQCSTANPPRNQSTLKGHTPTTQQASTWQKLAWNFSISVLVGQEGRLHGLAGVAGRARLAEAVGGDVAVLALRVRWGLAGHGARADRAQRRRQVRLGRLRQLFRDPLLLAPYSPASSSSSSDAGALLSGECMCFCAWLWRFVMYCEKRRVCWDFLQGSKGILSRATSCNFRREFFAHTLCERQCSKRHWWICFTWFQDYSSFLCQNNVRVTIEWDQSLIVRYCAYRRDSREARTVRFRNLNEVKLRTWNCARSNRIQALNFDNISTVKH